MKLSTGFFLIAFGLAACGGGGTTDVPDAVVVPTQQATIASLAGSPAPADFTEASAEADRGFFYAYVAESELSETKPRYSEDAAKSGFVRVKVWAEDNETFYIQNSDGDSLEFKENDGAGIFVSPTSKEYNYTQVSGKDAGVLSLVRTSTGGVVGRYDAKPGNQFGLKSNLNYGWRADSANLPNSGKARFESPDGGTLFMSDGRRLFGGTVELNVDFGASRVDGTLFKNFNKGDPGNQLMEAEVLVNNASIAGDGTISGGTISINPTNFLDKRNSFDPAYNNYDGAPNIASSSLQGEFTGTFPEAVVGGYGMKGTISRASAIENFEASGVFTGVRQ